MPTFFLTAAEHSGDAHGAALIRALRKRYPDATFAGVGGDLMAAAGCRLIANPVKRSAMLAAAMFTEARYWFKTLRLIKRELQKLRPSVVIPIDSSAINLKIAGVARDLDIKVLYYVAPQIWASRPWRIKKIKDRVNTLCCIFPFEEKYFRERGVNAVYVGHPMFDTPADAPEYDPNRLEPPLPKGEPKIAIFPGSRRAEIKAHMPPMLEVISEIKGKFPRVSIVAVAPSEERAWQIRHALRSANTPVEIRTGSGDAVIRWADFVLSKSGTTTLQVAKHKKPMVAMFAVPRWQWMFARFFITTPWIVMVNILAQRELVPEYVPFYGSPLPLARECIEILLSPQLQAGMVKGMGEVVAGLVPGEAGFAADRVAAEVAKLL